MAQIPVTITGAERLKVELQRLRAVDRPEVIQAIAEARAQGDLSENAEYESARKSKVSSKAVLPRLKPSFQMPWLSTQRHLMLRDAVYLAQLLKLKIWTVVMWQLIKSLATTRLILRVARFLSAHLSHVP